MTQKELVELGEGVLMSNCRRSPLVLVRGSGARVWDADGRSYLDFVSGVAVNALGHAPEVMARALSEQAHTLMHVSNLYYSDVQIEAAGLLASLTGMDRVYFCNSGAEAVESAIKLARKYGRESGGRYEIVTARGSFHGRTMGALAATGQTKYQESFTPSLPGFCYAGFNDLPSWERAVTSKTCALMVEAIQGEGGVHPAEPEFLQGLAELARERGLLLIMDEVQTGVGRTGRNFAWQRYDVMPDIMTLAKGLGGGFPVGALAAQESACVFTPGDHQSTFGGNPLAARAVVTCLRTLVDDRLAERAEMLGNLVRESVLSWREAAPRIRELRGFGLLLGLEIEGSAPEVAHVSRERGLLLNAINEHTLRLVPPLTIPEEDLAEGLEILRAVLAA